MESAEEVGWVMMRRKPLLARQAWVRQAGWGGTCKIIVARPSSDMDSVDSPVLLLRLIAEPMGAVYAWQQARG